MPNTALEGPERPPATGGAAECLVILLHGLGADGEDLIGLSEAWHSHLPGAHFCAPNAPHPCDMAPSGRQWFSLQTQEPAQILAGIQEVAPSLERFIDERLAALGLGNDRLALVGFSQGTMMSLHVAYRRQAACAGVLGYSGSMMGAETLESELRAKPPAMLIHGDADDVIPAQATLESAGALGAAGVAVQWHISRGVGHGIAPDGLDIGGKFLADLLGA